MAITPERSGDIQALQTRTYAEHSASAQSSDNTKRKTQEEGRLGLALYASSTIFLSVQSIFSKLLGEAIGEVCLACGRASLLRMPSAGSEGFPVHETVFARSIVVLLLAALPLAISRSPPWGSKQVQTLKAAVHR